MEIIKCYADVLKNKYADLDGRAGRKEFWYFTLVNMTIAVLGLVMIFRMSFANLPEGNVNHIITFLNNVTTFSAVSVNAIFNIYTNATFMPQILVGVRRLHDIGKSGWWLLFGFIPILGQLYLLYLFCKSGEPGENEYRYSANLPENHVREVLRKYVDVLKNKYAKFGGRARRKEYWLFIVGDYLVYLLLGFAVYCLAKLLLWATYGLAIDSLVVQLALNNEFAEILKQTAISGVPSPTINPLPDGAVFIASLPDKLATIYLLGTLIPLIAVNVRRLHDIGKSGWWTLIILIPFFGILYLTYLHCKDSATGENNYGPNPKENQVSLN